jgi:hypothetical protein
MMLKIFRSKETRLFAVVTRSRRNKCDNLNNISLETSRHFRNKKTEYIKDKIDDLATSSKNKNIRDLHRGIK